MKKRLLGLLVVVCMCLLTCGNEPPEEFYEGTPEDDAKIDDILNNDYPELLVTTDGFVDSLIAVTIPGIEDFEGEMLRADSPLVMQHIDSSGFVVDTLHRYNDLWYAKDTTCTVYLWDTFYVESWVHRDTILVGHYDSMFVDTVYGDTTWHISTIDTILPTGDSAYAAEDIYGDGRRLIFLEPTRTIDSVLVDTLTQDTIEIYWGGVIEPFEWNLRRISYGAYYYPTRGTEAPAINRVLIVNQLDPALVDTILSSNTDTLYTGHVMNRFRAIDSLLEYTLPSPTDTVQLEVTIEIDDLAQSAISVYYAACGDTPSRVNLDADGHGFVQVTGQGIVNLYFEAVFWDSYYYVNPNQGYFATVWLIPVRVN